MKRFTILMMLLGLMALPASASAQGDDGDESGDETTEEGEAEAAPADEAEAVPADEVAPTDEPAPADGAEASAEEPAPDGEPVAEPATEAVWGATPDVAVEPEPEAEEVVEAEAEEVVEADPAQDPRRQNKPDFTSPGDRYRRLGTAVTFSIGGSRLAVFDEGITSLRSDADFHLAQWELGVQIVPRLGVSLSGLSSQARTMSVNGSYDETSGTETWLQVTPTVSAWEVSARFVPTPPFFPVRGFVRAGGGMYLVHVRVTDSNAGGNLRQRDHRGVAPFATVGLGAEITTPTRLRRKAIPLSLGMVIEGGARVGGGGEVTAAPSSQLAELGGVDVGPWYFRVAFQMSWWPKPKVPRAIQ